MVSGLRCNVRIFYDIAANLNNIENKISFVAFTTFISMHFGGSTWLLMGVQYIFIADFIFDVFDALSTGMLSLHRVWQGIKKIVSLYFGVLVVGFGTRAFDIAISDRMQIEYNGMFLFDVFLCILIVFGLSSINHYLAHLGFGVNQDIDTVIHRFKGKTQNKLESFINKALSIDNSRQNIEKQAEKQFDKQDTQSPPPDESFEQSLHTKKEKKEFYEKYK